MTKRELQFRLREMRWRIREAAKRCGIALRYAIGRTSTSDAHTLLYDAQKVAGYYGLESLSEESVLTVAQDRYGDVDALPALVRAACRRVWNKWSSAGHVADAAEDWAMELVAEYAKEDGIELRDSWSSDEAEEVPVDMVEG